MKTKTLPIEESVGLPLSHDLTLISPEKGFKGARFKKGHIVKTEDLPVLRSMGRANLTILELEQDEVHEDDAALRLSKVLAGANVTVKGPGEGKCSLFASCNGLLQIDKDSINAINLDQDWIIATLPDGVPVKEGENLAGFRVLPLAVRENQVKLAEEAGSPISVLPFRKMKIGLITTGRELAEGNVKDAFCPKLEKKLKTYGSSILKQVIVSDEEDLILAEIDKMLEEKVDMIICTGGMSVDADDVTTSSIRARASEILFKGIPILPGCHIMLARSGKIPVLGVPAGAVFEVWTSLDLILPRVLAGIYPTFEETRKWGVGGLCRKCDNCNFPNCGFAAR